MPMIVADNSGKFAAKLLPYAEENQIFFVHQVNELLDNPHVSEDDIIIVPVTRDKEWLIERGLKNPIHRLDYAKFDPAKIGTVGKTPVFGAYLSAPTQVFNPEEIRDIKPTPKQAETVAEVAPAEIIDLPKPIEEKAQKEPRQEPRRNDRQDNRRDNKGEQRRDNRNNERRDNNRNGRNDRQDNKGERRDNRNNDRREKGERNARRDNDRREQPRKEPIVKSEPAVVSVKPAEPEFQDLDQLFANAGVQAVETPKVDELEPIAFDQPSAPSPVVEPAPDQVEAPKPKAVTYPPGTLFDERGQAYTIREREIEYDVIDKPDGRVSSVKIETPGRLGFERTKWLIAEDGTETYAGVIEFQPARDEVRKVPKGDDHPKDDEVPSFVGASEPAPLPVAAPVFEAPSFAPEAPVQEAEPEVKPVPVFAPVFQPEPVQAPVFEPVFESESKPAAPIFAPEAKPAPVFAPAQAPAAPMFVTGEREPELTVPSFAPEAPKPVFEPAQPEPRQPKPTSRPIPKLGEAPLAAPGVASTPTQVQQTVPSGIADFDLNFE